MKNVLILDDDDAFRALLTPLIESRGRTCIGAGTVAEALALVDRQEPELVIVDYMLPDGDGGEFVAALRGRGSRAVFICLSASLTGWALFEQIQEEQAIELVLRKPIFPKSFAAHLDRLLPAETDGETVARTLAEKMAALNAQYAKTLPAKIDALSRALAIARATPSERGPLDAVIGLAHRLHGTAASYGCTAVGRAAGRIERAMEALVLEELAPAEAWVEIDEAFESARAQVK